jgi:hypothetical protein
MALDEWRAAETEDDKARAAARVVQLAPPGKLWDLIRRLDELESIRMEYGVKQSDPD